MKYVCTEPTCSYEGVGRYATVLKWEICMDIHNIASIFCPYCQNIMVLEEEAAFAEAEV